MGRASREDLEGQGRLRVTTLAEVAGWTAPGRGWREINAFALMRRSLASAGLGRKSSHPPDPWLRAARLLSHLLSRGLHARDR